MSPLSALPTFVLALAQATPSAPQAKPAVTSSAAWAFTVPELQMWQWVGLAVLVVGSLAASLVVERLLLAIGMRVARLTVFKWDDQLVTASKGPLRLVLWAAQIALGVRLLQLPKEALQPFDLLVRSLVIIAVTWFIQRSLGFLSEYLAEKVEQEVLDDPDKVRGLRTQVVVLRHFFEVATYVVGAALLLLQFDVVRNVGVSLLASAGIAGLVLGLAAQKSISTLLAGFQLSITQPIRIGDAVVVETEYGTVEEITLTYVVVKLWDLRRLVLPITYFLEKPFQNWSKGEPEILAVVTLEVDFTTDIEAFRAELRRALESPQGRALWNGKTQKLVVTNASDRTLTLRVTASAANPDAMFDLRYLIRERLVAFLVRHPNWMPVSRNQSLAQLPPSEPDSKRGP